MEKLLLHICCAPCSVACIRQLREEMGIEPVGFWYNPNIHPLTEYRARRDTLIRYADQIALKLIVREEYGLLPFTQAVCGREDNRCAYCYESRFEETARYAAAHGFEAFTTTLTVSPYQNHPLIFEIAGRCAEKHGVQYLPIDFSPRFRSGQAEARELGLYMQKYCGCVYSEAERYAKEIEKDRLKFIE